MQAAGRCSGMLTQARCLAFRVALAPHRGFPSTRSGRAIGLKSAWLKAYYDHPMPAFAPIAPLSTQFNSGGEGAEVGARRLRSPPATRTPTSTSSPRAARRTPPSARWHRPERRRPDDRPADAGREVRAPRVRHRPPLGDLPEQPRRGLGLQHDVEATPKGDAILNTDEPRRGPHRHAAADRRHRRARPLPRPGRPRPRRARRSGGLEIIDITDSAKPDGDRAHEPHRRGAHGQHRPEAAAHRLLGDLRHRRASTRTASAPNEVPGAADRFDLDGFEVVDLSSCMNFPAGTSSTEARALPARRSSATATRAPRSRSATRPGRRSTAATSSRSTRTTG